MNYNECNKHHTNTNIVPTMPICYAFPRNLNWTLIRPLYIAALLKAASRASRSSSSSSFSSLSLSSSSLSPLSRIISSSLSSSSSSSSSLIRFRRRDFVLGAFVDLIVGAFVDLMVGAFVDLIVGALVDLEVSRRTASKDCTYSREISYQLIWSETLVVYIMNSSTVINERTSSSASSSMSSAPSSVLNIDNILCAGSSF